MAKDLRGRSAAPTGALLQEPSIEGGHFRCRSTAPAALTDYCSRANSSFFNCMVERVGFRQASACALARGSMRSK